MELAVVVAGWAGRRRYPGGVAVRRVSPDHLLAVAGDRRQVRRVQLPGVQTLRLAGNGLRGYVLQPLCAPIPSHGGASQ